MKTFLIIRFDKTIENTVDPVFSTLFDFLLDKDLNNLSYIIQSSTSVIIFKSECKHKEIYLALGKIIPVVAFFLIDVTETDFCIHMPEPITSKLKEFLGKNYVNKAEYSEDLSLKQLEKSLQDAIDDQNYELAAGIRDKIKVKKENK